MKHHIFVTVQGGVAEVCEDTVPVGIVVEILDFRRLRCGSRARALHVVAGTPSVLASESCSVGSLSQRLSLSDYEAFLALYLNDTVPYKCQGLLGARPVESQRLALSRSGGYRKHAVVTSRCGTARFL